MSRQRRQHGNNRAFTNNSEDCFTSFAPRETRISGSSGLDTNRIANNYTEIIYRCCEHYSLRHVRPFEGHHGAIPDRICNVILTVSLETLYYDHEIVLILFGLHL